MTVKSPLFETELENIGTGSLVVCFALDDFKGYSACVYLVSDSQILHIWKALVCLAGSWDEVTVPEEQSCFCILMTVCSGTASRKIKQPIRILHSQDLSENAGLSWPWPHLEIYVALFRYTVRKKKLGCFQQI